MIVSTSPKGNAPVYETEALDAKPHVNKEYAMAHSTVTKPQAQYKALIKARRDASFQRFMFTLLSVAHNPGQRFDRASVEGFRHA